MYNWSEIKSRMAKGNIRLYLLSTKISFYCTFPLMVNVFIGVFVFDLTINDLVNGPFVAALNVTFIFPESFGFTGVFEKSATEQPQEGATS